MYLLTMKPMAVQSSKPLYDRDSQKIFRYIYIFITKKKEWLYISNFDNTEN